MRTQIQSFPSATWRMLPVLASSEAGSMPAKSSKRLPRDSTSMRTKAWLSFFHRMRFFPETEKQNERCPGNVGPGLSEAVTDLVGREGVCVLVAGGELMKREKKPFDLLKVVVGLLSLRTEGSI